MTQDFEFKSKSNPDRKPYIVKVYEDGTMSCDCRGWTNKKVGKPRECTHTKQVAKMGHAPPTAPDADAAPEVEKLPVMRPNDGTMEFAEGHEKIVQLKYDGTYAFLIKEGDRVIMPGRSFKSDYTENHPEFVRDANKLDTDFILCGELVFVDKDGNDQFLTALAKKETWEELGLTPKFVVFDVLKYGSFDMINQPWYVRDNLLKIIFLDRDFESTEHIRNYVTEEEKALAWDISKEGVVIKDINSKIKDGRTSEWRKVKKLKAEDFWAIGFTKGTGARATTFGAMMLAEKELTEDGRYKYITKTSGFTNADLEHFIRTTVRNDELQVEGTLPSDKLIMYLINPILVEIKYQRKTETGSLIMPRFVKERTDITG